MKISTELLPRLELDKKLFGIFLDLAVLLEPLQKRCLLMIKTLAMRFMVIEEDGRYVTESRLKKMLTHEVNLIEKRLSREKHPE
jgi:hypothetical protein